LSSDCHQAGGTLESPECWIFSTGCRLAIISTSLVRALSDEEGTEREKLILLYRQHGLLDWIYD